MPIDSDLVSRPIPRPAGADNVRMVRKLFSDPPVALDEISANYGPICALGAGPVRVVVIGGPELIQQLFATPVESFRWAHRFNVIGLRFVIGRSSMIVSDGTDHDRRRAPAQPAFARRRLNDWIPTILGRTEQKMLSDQAWLPFGRRPHSCLGFALAQMDLTLIVARLAQRLDVTAENSDLPRPVGLVVNRPEGGAHLRVIRRVRE